MPVIKSLEDLNRIRGEALEKKNVRAASGNANVVVGMGSCGIASGAGETMKTILALIEAGDLRGILVTKTGCIGLCGQEPIVQVAIGEGPKTTYGKVTPEVAKRIIKEHVLGGRPVHEHRLEA